MLPIVYIQLHFRLTWLPPFIEVRFKIGHTVGRLKKRSKEIARSTEGRQLPIFFAVVPFVSATERALQKHFSFCHAPLPSGSGRMEWYSPGPGGVNLLEAVIFYLAIWTVEILAVLYALKNFNIPQVKIIIFLLA
jgi:hypothetical protein